MGRILVTGGTGFVGRRVTARLVEHGHPLTIAMRRNRPGDQGGDVRVADVGEIGPDTDWTNALRDVSTVIHLAAHVHVAPERAVAEADLFDRVNHLGTLNLYRQASEAGVRLFLFLSSITVLGGANEGGRPFDDDTAPSPETPYGRSKRDAEDTLTDCPGAPLVILRPPLIAGPGVGGNLRTLARLAALPVPLPFGAVRNRRTLLSLDNLASALETVIARPVPGTFVLGDRAPLSTAGIIAALRRGAGRRPGLVPVPPAMLAAAAHLAGRGGDAQRLLSDLEVDSSRFRACYDWSDEVGTIETLEAVVRAAA